MSQTAIQSGLYEELTNLADTVDDFLIHIRCGDIGANDPARRRLADFLVHASSDNVANDLATLRLLSLIGCNTNKERSSLARLGKVLRSHDPVPQAAVDRLEKLGRDLEARRSETAAKLRGNIR